MAIEPPDEGPMPSPRRFMPPPPPNTAEVAAHAQDLVGTWQCKGTFANGDGSSQPRHATITAKLDLAGSWLAISVVETGETTGKRAVYRTFDPVAKQWTQVEMESGGGRVVTTSPGWEKGGWVFTGVEQSTTASIQVREHEERGKDGVKLWGEALLGGAWAKTYELACVKEKK